MEPIDPAFEGAETAGPPITALTVASARRVLDGRPGPPAVDEVRAVNDRTIPGPDDGGVPIRVYDDRDQGAEPVPLLVWCHKGGFFSGDVDTEDPVARALAAGGERLVVSVDYRLAPEHPFPAAFADTVATLEWAAEYGSTIGGDPDRLVVGGHSAGGTLAAAAALADRDFGRDDLAAQLIVYAGLNPYPLPFAEQFDAYDEPDRQHGLSLEGMAWSRNHYLPDPIHGRNPYAYPLQATDLADLPPAVVVTAGYDPMCDDGEAYADRLAAGGTPVTHRHHERLPHGFLARPDVAAVGDAIELALADLDAAMQPR